MHKSDPHDPCISPGRFGLRIGLIHRFCVLVGRIFSFRGVFPLAKRAEEKYWVFFRERSERNLFLLAVYSPGIIFTLLVSTHHPHNSQICEPVTAKLWKTLHPKQSQQPKGAPCCWVLILMFDTLHSRHSSESNAVWPACGVVPKVHEDRVNFVVSHSFMCGSLTLRSCDTVWVWVPGCTKPNGV